MKSLDNIKKNLVKYMLYLAYFALIGAAFICGWFIFMVPGQRLLAVSVLVTIIVGGFINMWRILESSKQSKDQYKELVSKLDELNSKLDTRITQGDERLAIDKERREEEKEKREEDTRDRRGKAAF